GFLFGAGNRDWRKPDVDAGDTHPVVCISYPMLEAYVSWLSAETGARYRPPTAAEWRSARGSGQPACAAANRRDAAYRARFGGRRGGDCNAGFATTAPVARFAPADRGFMISTATSASGCPTAAPGAAASAWRWGPRGSATAMARRPST